MTGSTGVIGEEQQVQHLQWNGLKTKIDNGSSLSEPSADLQQQQQQQQQLESLRAALQQLEGVRIGVALIGLGRMGLIHLRNSLRELEARLLYCFDTDHLGVQQRCSSALFFDELGVRTLHCDQFQVALDDPHVEAVIIATPTRFHEPYIRRALEAGKNVLCEKPLTASTETILPLYELAQARRVSLMCAFNRRYDEDFRAVRARALAREHVGDIHLVRITSRDPAIPPLAYLKTSGGLLHDSVVHDIDMSMWLMRQLPVRVQVTGKTFEHYFRQNHELYRELDAEERAIVDTLDDFFLVIVTLTFPDGSLAIIDNSRQSTCGYDQRIEVFCNRATFKFDGKRPTDVVEFSGVGAIGSPAVDSFATRYQAAYASELRDLVRMAKLTRLGLQANARAQREQLLEPNRPMLVYATHRTADAGLQSWQSGGRPVEIEWSPEVQAQFNIDIA